MGVHASAIDDIARTFVHEAEELSTPTIITSAGFGLLHICKCCVRPAQRYELTNGIDIFSRTIVQAIFASATPGGREIAANIPHAALAFTDKHSDEDAYKMVSKELLEILIRRYVATSTRICVSKLPEAYLGVLKAAKKQPSLDDMKLIDVAVNRQGHIIISDIGCHVLRVGLNRIPEPFGILAGMEGETVYEEGGTSLAGARFDHPAGLLIVPRTEKGKQKEDLIVCNSGGGCLYLISGIHDLNAKCAKNKIFKINVGGLGEHAGDFKPWAISRASNRSQLFVSNANAIGNEIYRIKTGEFSRGGRGALIGLGTFMVVQTITSITHNVWGLAFDDDVGLLAAGGSKVSRLDVVDANTVPVTFASANDATSVRIFVDKGDKQSIAVVDHAAHVIRIYDTEGTPLETWGMDARPDMLDGPVKFCRFCSPTAIAFIPAGRAAYVICLRRVAYVTHLDFGVEMMKAILNIYKASCFVPASTKPPYAAVLRANTLGNAVTQLRSASDMLCGWVSKRSVVVGHRVKGLDGCASQRTVERIGELAHQLQMLLSYWTRTQGHTAANWPAKPFTNEARIEHEHSTPISNGQYRVLTPQQYRQRLSAIFAEGIIMSSACGFSKFTGMHSKYEKLSTPITEVTSNEIMRVILEADIYMKASHHQRARRVPGEKVQLRAAQTVCRHLASRPVKTIRDFQRGMLFPPFIVTFKRSDSAGSSAPDELHAVRINLTTSEVTDEATLRHTYRFLPGDVLITIDDSAAGGQLFDVWICSHPFERSQSGECEIKGFQLDSLDRAGFRYMLDVTCEEEVVMRSNVVMDIPRDAIFDNIQSISLCGDIEFQLEEEWHGKILQEIYDKSDESINEARHHASISMSDNEDESKDEDGELEEITRLHNQRIEHVAQGLRRSAGVGVTEQSVHNLTLVTSHTHTHIHTYTHTHIHTYTHTYIHNYPHTHTHRFKVCESP